VAKELVVSINELLAIFNRKEQSNQRIAIRTSMIIALLCSLLAFSSCGGSGTTSTTGQNSGNTGTSTYNWNGTWTVVWSDEFNAADGSAPDPSKWTYDLGGGGWGNQELETYTNLPENVQISGGNLVVTAVKKSDGSYTSARLKTQGLFSQQYGRFEARIKIPAGQGMWPAFWMLGNNITTAGWPTCGEVDIMENIGKVPATNYGSIHAPSASGEVSLGGEYDASVKLSDDFHVYALEWEPGMMRFYVDSTLYESHRTADFASSSSWVFDQQPMFIIMNVAVGGSWPGAPDSTTSFPQQMLVDYVRVYKRQ
jgi:beta-glucanase (GH16 family)